MPGNTISNCKFTGNSTYNVENRTTNSITATDNWWSTIDVAVIKIKIWDYYDDINYGEVVLSPLLMTEEGPSNYVPVVDVLVNPLLGRVPLTITFTASATDSDGTIELYEWDFDGDGTYDWNSTENGDTTYTYTIGNYYTTELKVVDNQGLANRLFYKIAVLDFDIEAEQQNDMVILGWGWGKFQTVIILPSALSFLNIGDEIHIVDKTGLITETCPVDETDIGIISVSHRTYVSSNTKYIFHCVGSINLCDFNNTIRPGYVDGNPIYFSIYDSNEEVYYEIIPETIESGLCVFGDTTLVPQTDYFYEIFLVDQNGNILLSDSDSVTTDAPVPVELSFFTAIEINNSVILNWQTITEINHYGLQVHSFSY